MAKKAKKTSKAKEAKPSKAKASPELPPETPTDQEIVLAGEAAVTIAESELAADEEAVAEAVLEHVEEPTTGPTKAELEKQARDAKAVADVLLVGVRNRIEGQDYAEMPFIRVVGRVVYILTVVGPNASCDTTPVIVAFLLHLPLHLDREHRQPCCNRDTIDVTEPNLARLIHRRMNAMTLAKWGLLEKAPKGYHLTEDAKLIFDGWPPRIVFNPHDPDLWRRRTASVRGGMT